MEKLVNKIKEILTPRKTNHKHFPVNADDVFQDKDPNFVRGKECNVCNSEPLYTNSDEAYCPICEKEEREYTIVSKRPTLDGQTMMK